MDIYKKYCPVCGKEQIYKNKGDLSKSIKDNVRLETKWLGKAVDRGQKDLIRQEKIIDILHPKKFWRYDSKNKLLRNILIK